MDMGPHDRIDARMRMMQAAGITGPHATPKGLRRGFGVNATVKAVPLNKVQK